VKKGGEVRHLREDARASCSDQPIGVTIRAVAAAAKSDDRHTGGNRRLDPRNTVLNHNAVLRCRAKTLRGE